MQIKKAIKKGFTLVELVVVIAVIAILAATSVGVYFGMLESANRSADQQAVVQMNKILLSEDTLGDVDNILDVHKAFERNGLSTKSYTALAKDHTFYYDTDYNKILYVNNSGDNLVVEYPEEHENETWQDRSHEGAQWFSLNLSIKETAPTEGSTFVKTDNSLTASVNSAAEFAYVMRQARDIKGYDKSIEITIHGELDMMGANVTIPLVSSNFTLKGEDGAVIKNLASNSYSYTNNEGSNYGAGLIGQVEGSASGVIDVAIKDIKISNVHIDGVDYDAGGCGILIGFNNAYSVINIENVDIENCTVAGNRSVGAIVGHHYPTLGNGSGRAHTFKDISLVNADVYTSGGRSALAIGYINQHFEDYINNPHYINKNTNEQFKNVEEIVCYYTQLTNVTADSNSEFLPYDGKQVVTIETIDETVKYYYDASYNSNTYIFNDAPTRNKYYFYDADAFVSFTIKGDKSGFLPRA